LGEKKNQSNMHLPVGEKTQTMRFPQYHSSSQKGEEGITLVKRIIESELKWAFRRNHAEHDFGIDAYIDVIFDNSHVTGKSIALQIKTGDSYFKETSTVGWIFRDSVEHLNYYLNLDIPVLIVLVNTKSNKAYWCTCDGTKTDRAGSQWKITVPFGNELNKDAKDKILKLISPIEDFSNKLEQLWMTNDILKDKETGKVLVALDKEQIVLQNYDQLRSIIERFESTAELLHSLKGKVDIGIHGYNDDPREIFQIEEVRTWTLGIFDNVVGLSYFLSTDELSQFLKQILFCWTDAVLIEESDFTKNGMLHKKSMLGDKEKVMNFLNHLFHDLNIFCKKNNLPIETNKEISEEISNYMMDIISER
jgi:hypothetical protein